MEEDIVIYFVIEILAILEHVHSLGFIHADVKPDNFVVKEAPRVNCEATTPEDMFQGCPRSLKLIDFGRAIDMKILPEDAIFTQKV